MGEERQKHDEQKYQEYDWLYHQYQCLEKSIRDIADECKVCPATIYRWLERHGIETRPRRSVEAHEDAPWRDEAWLREKYDELGTSVAIAELGDVTPGGVRYWMEKFDIERNPVGGARENTGRDITMTYALLLEAIVEMYEQRGDWPTTVQEYNDNRPDWAPAKSTMYNMDGFESWQQTIQDAQKATRD